eukprot:3302129-Heterocapsa_arctica.AAC.1
MRAETKATTHSMIGTASWTTTPLVTPPVLTGTPVVSPAPPDAAGTTLSFGFQKRDGLLPALNPLPQALARYRRPTSAPRRTKRREGSANPTSTTLRGLAPDT